MRPVGLIRASDDLQILRDHIGEDLEDFQLYVLIPIRYLELVKEGFHPRILSEHLSREEAYDVYRRGFDDSSRVVKEVGPIGPPLALNLPRLFKFYYWWLLYEAYAFDLAIGRIAELQDGNELWYVQRKPPEPSNHSELTNAAAISEHMIDALTGNDSFQVRPVPGPPMQPSQERKDYLTTALRRPWRLLRSLFRAFSSASRSDEITLPTGPRSIAMGNNYDALIVLPDAMRIASEKNLLPLLVTEHVDRETFRTGLTWMEDYDEIEQWSMGRYFSRHKSPLSDEDLKQSHGAAEETFERFNQIDLVQRYDLTSFMGCVVQEFGDAVQLAHVIDSVLAAWAGSSVVVTNFDGVNERILEQLAGRHSIEVHARPHGWLANPEGMEIDATYYYCDGPLRVELTDKIFSYKDKIETRLDPSLLNVSNEWLALDAEEQRTTMLEKRARLSIEARHVILLMTTAARPQIQNEFDYRKLKDSWNAVLDFLAVNPDIHVLVKSHKNNYDAWVAQWAREQGVRNLTTLSGKLEDVLVMADLVVDFGKPGTATLSALLFERPLLLYRGMYKYVREYGDLTHDKGRSFLLDDPASLITQFDTFKNDPVGYSVALLAKNAILRSALVAETA